MTETIVGQIQYPHLIGMSNASEYNAAIATIFELAQSEESINGKVCYYLNDEKTEVARTDIIRRTIELSDKVDADLVDDIMQISKGRKSL